MVRWKGWDRVVLDPVTREISDTPDPSHRIASIAPIIISASRSTDIPALYGEWFMERLRQGFVTWTSPYNGIVHPVSFARTRVFAFWSKNPRPFLPALETLQAEGRQCIVLFTLNDYEEELLEPGIPPLDERMRTFSTLSSMIGRGRLTWRFDPLLLSDTISVDDLLSRIERIGDRIAHDAGRLVVSFIDIEKYPRVKRTLASSGISGIREFSSQEIERFASGLSDLCREWHLEVQACGEEVDLSRYGIGRGACISYDLLATEFSKDPALMDFLRPTGRIGHVSERKRELKDPGQRRMCGCIVSKDIGRYSTCIHGCRYCYATKSPLLAGQNHRKYCAYRDQGVFFPGIIE